MANRRAQSGPPLSLFSFQDIITCVTAIMICIALIMALELISSRRASAPATTRGQIDHTRAAIADLRREIALLGNQATVAARQLQGLPTLDETALRRAADQLVAEVERLQRDVDDARRRERDHERKLAARSQEDASESQRDAERLAQLERRKEELEAKIEALDRGNRLFFRPGDATKTMWLVEIQKSHFTFARVGTDERPRQFTSISSSELNEWLRTLDPEKDAFLLIVKPDGESRYQRCKERLLAPTAAGGQFDVGVQVASADQQIIDPETGAGPP